VLTDDTYTRFAILEYNRDPDFKHLVSRYLEKVGLRMMLLTEANLQWLFSARMASGLTLAEELLEQHRQSLSLAAEPSWQRARQLDQQAGLVAPSMPRRRARGRRWE